MDPVAVLAIFDEVGVNKNLYFLVFGESLFNDGVTIVLYNTMVSLSQQGSNIDSLQYVLAFFSFFFVVFGGLFIGFTVGVLSAFFCKFTKDTPVVEPLVMFSSAYFSFVLTETLHWSGIIALIGCGIAHRRYASQNISQKSLTTIKYGIRALSSCADIIIFLYLGIVVIGRPHHFNPEFTIWTVVLCLVVRFIVIYALSAFSNRSRIEPITRREQFIMAYGGLRGAVGFSLVIILADDPFKIKITFQTTTLIVIFLTVFFMGITLKPLVNVLHIQKKEVDDKSYIANDIHNKVNDHLMAGKISCNVD